MIWLWGQGTRPDMPLFKELYGVNGSVISAVDLLNGIGRLVGLNVVKVPGATGYYDTNYKGKAEFALESLKDGDFVFVHVEAPDEAGHNGDLRAKITAVENFDKLVVGTILEGIKDIGDARILVMPDHATPVSIRTHTSEPVPFAVCGAGIKPDDATVFTEKAGRAGDFVVENASLLMKYLVRLENIV
jgi:2,3-bisphosphoglycerate-independent phosphoglycerate mutase